MPSPKVIEILDNLAEDFQRHLKLITGLSILQKLFVNGQMRKDNPRIYSSGKTNGEWRMDYNELRPHSALGYKTPIEFLREQVC